MSFRLSTIYHSLRYQCSENWIIEAEQYEQTNIHSIKRLSKVQTLSNALTCDILSGLCLSHCNCSLLNNCEHHIMYKRWFFELSISWFVMFCYCQISVHFCNSTASLKCECLLQTSSLCL